MDSPQVKNVNLSSSSSSEHDPEKGNIVRTMERDLKLVQEQISKELQTHKADLSSQKPIMPPAAAQIKKTAIPPTPEMPPVLHGQKDQTAPVPPKPITPSTPPIPPSIEDKMKEQKKQPVVSEIKIPQTENVSLKKIVLVISGVVVIVAASISGIYFWKKQPTEAPKTGVSGDGLPPIEISKPELPISLILASADEKITISGADQQFLLNGINNAANSLGVSQGEFERLLVMLSTETEKRYLSFQEIAQILEVNIPQQITDNLEEDHSLFVYNQKEGARLGLVIKVKDKKIVKSELSRWESAISNDLAFIFLNNITSEKEASSFRDNTYNGINIRYMNFPTNVLSLDYALLDDKNILLISTSKESMYRSIDNIMSANKTEKTPNMEKGKIEEK